MIIINTLEHIRKENGLTQEYMASQLEIAVSTYNQYENGVRSIPCNIAVKAADILGVKINDIFLPTKFTVSKSDNSSLMHGQS